MANLIGEHMELTHTKFIKGSTPEKLERKTPDGQITVTYKMGGEVKEEDFDTVLFAIGRYALTANIGLDKAGINVESNGKIKCPKEDE